MDRHRQWTDGSSSTLLPTLFEYLHIGADLPHGVFRNDKAKRLLGRQPRDTLEAHYTASRKRRRNHNKPASPPSVAIQNDHRGKQQQRAQPAGRPQLLVEDQPRQKG